MYRNTKSNFRIIHINNHKVVSNCDGTTGDAVGGRKYNWIQLWRDATETQKKAPIVCSIYGVCDDGGPISQHGCDNDDIVGGHIYFPNPQDINEDPSHYYILPICRTHNHSKNFPAGKNFVVKPGSFYIDIGRVDEAPDMSNYYN